jgi:hypothetical protein
MIVELGAGALVAFLLSVWIARARDDTRMRCTINPNFNGTNRHYMRWDA